MGGHGHACDGDHNHDETPEMGVQYSLYSKIDTDNLQCLNESIEDSGKTVFKPWEERLDFEKFVESDADQELLFNIPFTGNVKLKGIIVVGGEGAIHPSKMRLFKNRPCMTFDDTGLQADQEFDLHPDSSGTIEYSTIENSVWLQEVLLQRKFFFEDSVSCLLEWVVLFNGVVKFSSTHHLTIHFPNNFGAETTKIYYIGLKGEFTPSHRHGVTICTYEAAPNVADHKINLLNQMSQEIQ